MKISFIVSDRQTNSKLNQHLHTTYLSTSPDKADVLVCIGGDGFMLRTLHNYHHLQKPIYGINCGTVGFLLNDYLLKDNLLDLITHANKYMVTPLSLNILTTDNKQIHEIAFNEVAILRNVEASANLELHIDHDITLSKLVADGLLIATPLGSTAYNRSCGGPILSLTSQLMAITPINPFKPLAWKGAVITDNHTIHINNLSQERAIKAQFDFQSIPNIQAIEVKLATSSHAILLFNQHADLENKIFHLQFREV